MDSVKASAVTPKKSKFSLTVAKVLHLRGAAGVAPIDGQKLKLQEKVKDEKNAGKSFASRPQSFSNHDDEVVTKVKALESLLAQLFASLSSLKASYAQLQYAQSPYDVEGIQSADESVVEVLKKLSELKQCFIKKQSDPFPEKSIVLAEIEEQKSLCKTYQIMGKKLESQLRLKDSEILYLREKLEESNRQNRLLEKTLNQSGQLHMVDNLSHSGLSQSHFLSVLRHTVKSIRSFVKLLMGEMKSADWDLDAAANSIVPDVAYWRPDDKCFAFECFVCGVMFDAFHFPNFSPSGESLQEKKNRQQFFFNRFSELKSMKVKEYLALKPRSSFAKFCRSRFLRLVHPQMETSFFGNLSQRSLVRAGEFPDTGFFASFAEMAKRVWLLHSLAFSFEPEAAIFQVQKGCRFSEVYMQCVAEQALLSSENARESDPPVAFTVVPGFRIAKTVIQSQVYLSPVRSRRVP